MKAPADPLKPQRINALTRAFYDDLLVYDAQSHRAHSLNKTAAAVWSQCNGDATAPEIARRLESTLQSGSAEALVEMAIGKLRRAGLLVDGEQDQNHPQLLSRRKVLRGIRTAAGVMIPVVATLVLPTPTEAASCFPNLHACSNNGQCCSGHCGLAGINLVCLP